MLSLFFFFNHTATPEIYTLSLHDALPICEQLEHARQHIRGDADARVRDLHDRVPSLGTRRSEEHTSELQSPCNLVCRLLLEKKKKKNKQNKKINKKNIKENFKTNKYILKTITKL